MKAERGCAQCVTFGYCVTSGLQHFTPCMVMLTTTSGPRDLDIAQGRTRRLCATKTRSDGYYL